MKKFEHEWILDAFAAHPTFFTKRMFGGLAAYLFGRQILLLVEPTKSGRWNWRGVLTCTDYARFLLLITLGSYRKRPNVQP